MFLTFSFCLKFKFLLVLLIYDLLQLETKDKIPPTQKSGIYKILCKDCSKSYIGKTKRNLNIRQKEHFRNIRSKQFDKSTVAYHVWIANHEMDREAKLLKREHKPDLQLTIWEKLFIHKFRNQIVYFETPKDNDLITRYLQLLSGSHLLDK